MNRRKLSPPGKLSPLTPLKLRSLEVFRGAGGRFTPTEELDITESCSPVLQEQETTRSLGHAKKRDSLSALARSAAFLL